MFYNHCAGTSNNDVRMHQAKVGRPVYEYTGLPTLASSQLSVKHLGHVLKHTKIPANIMDANSYSAIDVLPFFPKHESELICQDKLRITWFELGFSQSRFNFEKTTTGSNACTIITVLLASACAKENIPMFGPFKNVSYYMIKSLGKAMIDGNQIHKKLMLQGTLPNINLTVPEGIKYAGKKATGIREWKSALYMQNIMATLHVNMMKHVEEWRCSSKRHYSDLYAVLICESRSALFIFSNDLNTVTLVDSHQHSTEKGACIAVTLISDLRCLCSWFNHMMMKYYRTTSNLYELSLLYHKKRK